jgi:hypothetical protein
MVVVAGARGRSDVENAVNGAKIASYVPSGLTPEEYQAIKEKEQLELSNKKFGLWGPKFLPSTRPNGDWMAMPSLWTGGFDSNSNNNFNDYLSPRNGGWVTKLRRIIPTFVVACTAVECIAVVCTLIIQKKMIAEFSVRNIVQFLYTSQKWKTCVARAVAAMALVRPFEWASEFANRRWLWSKRRITVTSLMMLLVSTAVAVLAGTNTMPRLYFK